MKNLGTTEYLDQGIAAEPGDIIYCTSDNKLYEYYDEGLGKPFGWREKKIDKTAMLNLGMTEYEINKLVVGQLPSLITEKQLASGKALIKEFVHNYSPFTMGHYMLLCNELRHYTVFEVCDEYEEKAEDIVLEVLQNVGVIQQINKAENENAIECWIKNQNGVFMFMLFDYDWGFITCQ